MTRSFASRSSRITLAVLAASCGLTALNRPALSQQTDVPTIILPGHISRIVDESQPLGALEASAPVRLAITLPLRNQAQMDSLLKSLYDPLDPLYGRFLTTTEFNAHFAPTAADYAAVRRFAEASGLKVVGTHSNNLVLDVQGTSAQVETAFTVKLMKYRSPQGLLFHAPNQEPSVPPSLIGKVNAIIGLDTAGVAHPHLVKRPAGAIIPHGATGPAGGFSPSDIKTAYNLNGVAETGTGQTLALYELDGYKTTDITAYENQFGLTHTPLQNVLVDGFNGSAGSGSDEVTLDIELMIALAPAATKIQVYEAPNSAAGAIDAYNKIATDNTAKEISTSWGLAEAQNTASARSSENTAFQQMAAQGQSIYAAAGDSGAYDNGSSISVDDPASQPYMVGVGGTSLTTAASGAYSSETTWNSGSISNGGGGGGISVEWTIPSYQSGVISAASKGSTTARNVPDVSLNADPNTGYSIYTSGSWQSIGGTSCAAPLWAAFTALVNQRRAANGSALLGFPNPAIYTIGKGARYSSDFHDIANGSTNLYYPAVTGFDDATGWGTLNGANLLTDLAGSGGTGGTVPAAPTSLAATAGNAQVSLAWTGSTGATSYTVYRSNSSGTETSYRTGLTTTSLTDTGLTNGTTYFYKVTAVNATGESAKSNEASATPVATITVPAAPTGLTATAGNAQVSLAWTGSTGAATYNVYRSTATGTETSYKTGLTTTSLTDTGLTNGTKYFYKVTAVNTAGESAKSTEASATPTAGGTLQQLLLNPGFESGATVWTAASGVIDNGTSEPSHTGSWKAWLNGYGSAHTDTLFQTVTIPSTVTTATLAFWLHIDTAETTTTTQFDTLKVQIRSSAGTVLATLATYSNLNAAAGYSQKSFSLSAYKGQTIQVYLVGVEDASLQTSFVVDDFTLNAQ